MDFKPNRGDEMKTTQKQYFLMIHFAGRDQTILPTWFGGIDPFYKTLKSAKAALKKCRNDRANSPRDYLMWIERVTTTTEKI